MRVRLNTNESPYPPPGEFGRRLAEAVADAEWHRYPDRAANGDGDEYCDGYQYADADRHAQCYRNFHPIANGDGHPDTVASRELSATSGSGRFLHRRGAILDLDAGHECDWAAW